MVLNQADVLHWTDVRGASPQLLVQGKRLQHGVRSVGNFRHIAAKYRDVFLIDEAENCLAISFCIGIEKGPGQLLDGGVLAPGGRCQQDDGEERDTQVSCDLHHKPYALPLQLVPLRTAAHWRRPQIGPRGRIQFPFGQLRVDSSDSPVSSKLLRLDRICGQPLDTPLMNFEPLLSFTCVTVSLTESSICSIS